MITAPHSLSASPTISWKCSHALPIQANTSDGSSFLSAINPSSDTERPNITFPIVFSNLREYILRGNRLVKNSVPPWTEKIFSYRLFSHDIRTPGRDQPKTGSRRNKRARALHAVRGE